MFGRLWRRTKEEAPLTGAPALHRQKTYSAESGYVYQYFYLGQRTVRRNKEEGTEYVFDVSADRKTSFPVTVFAAEAAFREWERNHGRVLLGTERYAVAKLALCQAFDFRTAPAGMREPVNVRAEDIETILATLGRD